MTSSWWSRHEIFVVDVLPTNGVAADGLNAVCRSCCAAAVAVAIADDSALDSVATSGVTVSTIAVHYSIVGVDAVSTSGGPVGDTVAVANGGGTDAVEATGTLASVFSSPNPASFDFQTPGSASAVASAIVDQVFINATISVDDNPELILGCIGVQCLPLIPYGFSSPAELGHPFSINARARNHEQEFLDSVVTSYIEQGAFNSSGTTDIESFRTNWARFTPVPELSSCWLFGVALMSLLARRRGREVLLRS